MTLPVPYTLSQLVYPWAHTHTSINPNSRNMLQKYILMRNSIMSYICAAGTGRSCPRTCVGQPSVSSVREVKEQAFGVDAAVEVGREAKTSPEARSRTLQSLFTCNRMFVDFWLDWHGAVGVDPFPPDCPLPPPEVRLRRPSLGECRRCALPAQGQLPRSERCASFRAVAT